VTKYGMNKEIGHMSFYDSKQSEYNFQKPYSDSTAEKIDKEVKALIDFCYQRTKKLLNDHREQLDIISRELLEKEILFQTDLERLIGKRPFSHQTTYEKFTKNTNGAVKSDAEAPPVPPIIPPAEAPTQEKEQ
jgi:AFG3 family protein